MRTHFGSIVDKNKTLYPSNRRLFVVRVYTSLSSCTLSTVVQTIFLQKKTERARLFGTRIRPHKGRYFVYVLFF